MICGFGNSGFPFFIMLRCALKASFANKSSSKGITDKSSSKGNNFTHPSNICCYQQDRAAKTHAKLTLTKKKNTRDGNNGLIYS